MHLVLVIAAIFGVLTAAMLMALFLPPPRVLMRRLGEVLARTPKSILLGSIVGVLLFFSLPRLHLFFIFVACLIALLLRPPRMLTHWFASIPPAPALSRFWLRFILVLFLLTSIIPLSDTTQLAGVIGWKAASSLDLYHLLRFTHMVDWDIAHIIANYPHEAVLHAGITGWGVILTLICIPRRRAALPFLAAGALIIAHSAGYKIYGSPAIVDNRASFPEGLLIDYLERPNIVVATDGSRHALSGITLPIYLDKLSPADQREFFAKHSINLNFSPDAASPSGYAAIEQFNSNCGNTFFPVPFPPRIPLYFKQDLATTLNFIRLPEPTS